MPSLFRFFESTGYVHLMGKEETGQQEWTSRIPLLTGRNRESAEHREAVCVTIFSTIALAEGFEGNHTLLTN
jgi:hypothetical protein